MNPPELCDLLSARYSTEKRQFYVGSTTNIAQRRKQHSNPFNSCELVTVFETTSVEKCREMETYLIHCLQINSNRPVNECPYSVGLKENARQYYVYLLFPDVSTGTVYSYNTQMTGSNADERAADRAAERQWKADKKAAERAAEKQRKADENTAKREAEMQCKADEKAAKREAEMQRKADEIAAKKVLKLLKEEDADKKQKDEEAAKEAADKKQKDEEASKEASDKKQKHEEERTVLLEKANTLIRRNTSYGQYSNEELSSFFPFLMRGGVSQGRGGVVSQGRGGVVSRGRGGVVSQGRGGVMLQGRGGGSKHNWCYSQ